MNKLQEIFNIDERITARNRKRETAVTLIYALLDVRQWKYLFKWQRSLKPGNTPYSDGMPWIAYGAIDFLEKAIGSNSKIFEYGSGGSTIFFAERAKELVSVEHDQEWHNILKKELKAKGLINVTYLLKTPKKISKEKFQHEYFRSWREPGLTFKDYVTSINDYDDNYFDLVSVDGRSRVACVKEAYSKVRKGGLIILDNSERKDYFEAQLFMRDKGCEAIHFFGLVGYETPLSQTTIWKK